MSCHHVSRRDFMSVAAAAVPALALGRRQQSTPAGRNIIFILSDDHRYDFMGFMGNPSFLQTPNMDRMAREGAHVQNAFVTTSLCSPSRASILTGLYSHKHGVVDNQASVPDGLQFFPQMLQKQGYETAFIGKWHMGHEHDDPRPGFDKWISFKGQGDYYNPVLNIDGERRRVEGYNPDILTKYAVDWIKQERQKPFFLYLSHKAVHGMFEPAKRHLGKYEDEKIEYPPSMADTEDNYRGKPKWVREQRNSWHGVDYMYHGQMDYETFYRRYCETVLGIDDSIGRLMQTLEDLGIADSTLVIYMGDNGFCFGEHGLIDKRHMYEESIRVPMLAYCPEMIQSGSKVGELVQNIDIAPTLLEAAGLTVPDDMDGRSFLPVLKGKSIPWRDAIYYEYYWERNFPQTPTMHGVRTDRYKYIHYHGIWDIDELYDLKTDPNEMNNLIFEPEQQDRIKKMNKMMYDWLERTNGMTIPLRRDRGFRAVDRKPE